MTNTKTPIRTAIVKGYMSLPREFYVYAEANGLLLGHGAGSKEWEVRHEETGMLMAPRSPRWNPKVKTKTAKFFDYLVAAPFPWAEWKEYARPAWANDAYNYVKAFTANNERAGAPAFSQSNF